MAEQFVSMDPNDFSKGGGLADDFDATITDVRFMMTDYDGALMDAVPVARIIFDIEGEEMDVMYSVGGKNDFVPSDDGKRLVVCKRREKITETAKFGMFLHSVAEAGFPPSLMKGDSPTYLIGMVGHFLRKAVEYKGMARKNDRDNTVLLCTQVIEVPGEDSGTKSKKSTGKAGGRKTTAKSKAAKVDDDLADTVAGIIGGVIVGNGGEISKKQLISELFNDEDIKALPDKREALKLIASDEFLTGRDEWELVDGMLTLA